VKFLEKILAKETLKFDLTLTSPPYNIGKEYESIQDTEDFISWCSTWLNLIHKNTSETGSLWLNLGYLEVPGKGKCVPIPYLLWDKSDFYLQQEIVWHYGAGVASKKRLSPRNEKWLFYTMKEDDYLFNLDDIRDPNVKYPNQKKNGKFRCNPLGKNPSDVWIFPKVTSGSNRSSKERTSHPAQFPLQVVERAMKASSNFSDIVFDPFSGSASTGVTSLGLGRLYIGTELRKDYIDESIERFKQFKKFRDENINEGQLLN
jgi:adenine-specific DNA-methyltransferase